MSQAPQVPAFRVSVFVPSVNEGAKSRTPVLKEKRPPVTERQAELGIEIKKNWDQPRCLWCRMWDPGKKSGEERPDQLHQIQCRSRPLGEKPWLEIEDFDSYGRPTGKKTRKERRGAFIGEAPNVSVRIPTRRVIQLPERDDDGNPIIDPETGKPQTQPFCQYEWKVREGLSWVWAGEKRGWIPWYEWQTPKPRDLTSERAPNYYETLKGSWLAHEAAQEQSASTHTDLPF